MSQSRRQSLIETVVGVTIGFAVSMALSAVVYPLHGHAFTLTTQAQTADYIRNKKAIKSTATR